MPTPDKIDAHQKALSLNLDATAFGSFAEIGAGQEVARWFLRVGGASGTVAKTISAYDKEVSDDLYGSGTRYVSQPRLLAMLDNEWAQLLLQLNATRGATTRFFSFVDTISARNFASTNECHGWVGVRFQTRPRGESERRCSARQSAGFLQSSPAGGHWYSWRQSDLRRVPSSGRPRKIPEKCSRRPTFVTHRNRLRGAIGPGL